LTTTNRRHTPNGWFSYNPSTNRWEPTELNDFPDWKNQIVTEIFRPNERGISRWIDIDDLKARYPDAVSAFGGNGSNFFTRNSPMEDFAIDSQREGNKIIKRRLVGLSNQIANKTKRTIRREILRTIRSQPCALTGTTADIECDHRCSRRPPNTDPRLQHLEDFQPLSKAANCRKRQVCIQCMQTGQRFDARELGFTVGWLEGDVTTQSCEGCFWYDIHHFRSSLILPPDHEP